MKKIVFVLVICIAIGCNNAGCGYVDNYYVDELSAVSDNQLDLEDGSVTGMICTKNEYESSSLSNVLGTEAECVFYVETFPMTCNYYLCGSENCLTLWGTSPDDVVVTDLDGDGKTEVIATVMWADGVKDVLIYRATDVGIVRAYGSSLFKGEYMSGYAWALMAEYLPESNQVQISYMPQDGNGYEYVTYDLDYKLLEWEQYEQ